MPTTKIATVGCLCLALAMGIGRFVYTPILPLMQQDGLIDIEQGGLLASVHFAGYLIGAFCAARLSFSPRLSLRLSLLAIGLSTLGMGLVNSFIVWAMLRFVAGFASALALVLVSNFFVRYLAERGHVSKQGWVFSGVGLGIVAAGLGTLAIMIADVGSAASWQLFGIATLALAIVLCIMMGAEIPQGTPPGRQASARKSPLLWSLILPYGALGMGYIIPATYLPVMAREVISDPLIFGWAWPLFGASAMLSTLLAARLQATHSIRRIWISSQLVMAIGLLIPAIYPSIAAIVAAGIGVGGTFMVITMMGLKETHHLAPKEDIMRQLAIMTASFAIGQMIGPLLAGGVFSITESFSLSLVLASAILLATAASLHFTTPKQSGQRK